MASKDEIRASGIVYDVKAILPSGKKTDAVVVSLEHSAGYSVVVMQPYRFGFRKKLITDDLFAQEGTHDIFSKG